MQVDICSWCAGLGDRLLVSIPAGRAVQQEGTLHQPQLHPVPVDPTPSVHMSQPPKQAAMLAAQHGDGKVPSAGRCHAQAPAKLLAITRSWSKAREGFNCMSAWENVTERTHT